jgi:general secretion pathway protein H
MEPTVSPVAQVWMLMLVPGICKRPHLLRDGGFTLIELLLVLLIAGIALTLLTVAGVSNPQRELRFEAEKLAQVLTLAREEAQVRGTAIRFEANANGYAFLVVKDREWQPLTDDDDLRARSWSQPTQWRLVREDDRGVIEFGRDAVDLPFSIELTRDGNLAAIKANGLGRFLVE